MKLKLLLCAALAFFAFGASAQAQTPVVVQCSVNNPTNPWAPCSSGNPLPVSASVTASIAPFLPSASGSRGTQFTVNTTTTSQTLPTGAAVVVSNEGTTNTMYCNAVGASATTADQPISPNGGWFVFGTANAGGSINCIASGGTTTANMVGGSGLPAGTGGGSGGGGGAVTIASGGVASGAYASGSLASGAGTDGWNATEGTKADSAYTSGSGSIVSILKGIFTGVTGSIPGGTNTVGGVTLQSVNITPTDCSGSITTGGTAQNAFTAQTTLHGFTIANIDSTSGSGEPLWISFTTTAAASTAASYPLAAPTATTFANLTSFTAPPGFGLNHALSVIGATTGHKFSCTWW